MFLPVERETILFQQCGSTYNALSGIWETAMKKRIKLEFFDRGGVKHSVSIEGEFTADKVNRLLEYAEIVAGSTPSPSLPPSGQDTKISRLLDVISTQFPDRAFDSRQLWQIYRETWRDEFSLGAVSTYLSRLVDRGALARDGSPAHWFYRLKPSPTVPQ
jgi:hypothetical protein